ncbi:MAG: hypothetical protein FD126_3391, partial [Elusimicrobia bacterium]
MSAALGRLAAAWLARRGPATALFDGLFSRGESAPPPTRRTGPAVDGEIVETGTFRIDTARALEKLSRFQLEDPCEFLLPWLRAAVRGGAVVIDLKTNSRGLTLEFDGEPLPARLLSDPFAGLFGEDGTERERELAYGLLASARLSPSRVEWASGQGPSRAWLSLGGPSKSNPGPRTALAVEWSGLLGRLAARRCVQAVEQAWAYGMAGKVSFHVDGRLSLAGDVPYGAVASKGL